MSEARAQKAELRRQLLESRGRLSADERKAAGRALGKRVRDLPELASGGTVAAYISMGTEPGTQEIVESMRSAGTRVLLPVLLPDNDLDWAEYDGPAALERTRRGLLEPTGPRLGPQAVTAADAILLPGLAVDVHGVRLGRGGGSYDRVLARLRVAGVHPPLMLLLYTHEVVGSVPREPHDHLVDVAITPEGVHRFPR
ncbi:5-formyltetrahydrofolate cyclo-ligase [Streptomyces sp. HPF1205]|uniref:5-formyltetrahydrofolate cyclo-ligase n=1 Tax=Streptomyces sp. HPF1205 TaxID=2873262 RepID=UPI001CEDF361|nr:5-formyltetrahydrofolate cyclo-ligase [Streptomyces sp. HPF1205]